MRAKFAWALLALLAVAGAYGFVHERLFSSTHWFPEGITAFLAYASVYVVVAAAVVWRAPGYLLAVALGAAIAWSAWWYTPLAPLAVLYFLVSCHSLGRLFKPQVDGVIAILIGASVWMLILWTSLHFRVNYWWVYVVAFAIPIVLRRPQWTVPKWAASRREGAGFAVLLFLLGAHFFVALKPEISADGLSMHLTLPMRVAAQGRWAFDPREEIWSLMPAGADSLYTGVLLLGGEGAAKLLNFAFLVISCALVVKLARRWTTPAWAYVIAALFASTPVVQLVTGSLFVENVWGALVAGAVYALIESEGVLAAALMGAATATKLIAAGFAVPVLAIVAWMGFKDRKPKTVLAAAAVFTALAAPPYVFAYAKSGNPIFPFANATFRSADYDATKSFADPRYDNVHPGWDVLYRMTFQSAEYIEGDGGALGFQYFLLLLPAVILVRRRDQAIVMGVALAGSALVLAGAPNMRYLYAAMPLASLAIAWTPWTALAPVLIVLNLWFLPAAGFYHNDFAFFDKSKKEAYLARQAPARLLIEKINHWAPGEPVAFFATDAIAGLDGPAFVDTWHSENYWKPVREALHATDVAAELKKRHIRYVIAPKDRVSQFETIHAFLLRWLDVLPNSAVGNRSLYTLRETELPLERDTTAMLAGLHDDTEQRVEYSGQWLHDPQFSQPVKGTVSYADKPGDFLRIWFEGRALTYIFTKAPNRGIGEIWLDDKFVRRVNQYADEVTWQSSVRIDGFVPGVHKFEIRVTGAKDKRASGAFVDFDALRVE